MKSEKLFAVQWDHVLKSNETMFDIDSTLDEDIKNGLPYNFNEYEKCTGFSKRHGNDLIRGEYILAESIDKSSKRYYSGMCFPDSATLEGLDSIMQYALGKFGRTFRKHLYQDPHSQLRVVDYFAISFFTLWALIVIVSTIYECIMISKKKPSIKWFTVFSLHSNILRVFKKTSSFERNVNCLYAIRTLSILWLIISDRFNVIYKFAFNNESAYQDFIKNGFSAFITLSDAAYDSIFIVSGFLLSIYCFRSFNAKNLNYLSLLLHRYIRYGPLLLVSVIYQLTIFQYTIRGPLAPKILGRQESCENYWFMSLVMLENYMRPDHMCVYHGWYFSIDFQFFIILPLLIYICHKSRKIGFIVIGIFLAIPYISMLGVLIYSNTPYDVFNRSSIYDMHSYFRSAPWLLSVVLASFCLDEKFTVEKKFRILNTIGAFIVFILLLIYVYLLQNKFIIGNYVLISAIFASFHRIFWSAGICWTIFYCYNLKEDGWFDGIINSSAWRPIAKISLTLQIVYPVYQHSIIFNKKEPYYFDSWYIFHDGLGDILICVLISLIINASVEMPFVWIERLINDKQNVKTTRNIKKVEIEMDEVALKAPEVSGII